MKSLALLLFIMSIGFVGEAFGQAQADATAKRMTATLTGRVVWRGQDLSHTSVSVYRDAALQQVYISGIPQLGDGQFTLRVEPGRYYLVAYVDVDKSGSFDTGDGLGMFGITDWGNENQNKQVIEVQDGEKIRGLEIPITARATYIDGSPTVVPLSEYEPSQLQQFQTELRKATSGCSGTIAALRRTPENPNPLQTGSKALILAYTDLSWKYRAGITRATDTGNWTLNLPPGKYYLMAIVDNNNTNKLDTGDDFGFYGVADMRKRGNFPQPVLVSANKFTENIEVAITATYQTRKKTQEAATSTLTGILSPVPGDVTGRIEVYSDPALVVPVASAETAPGGAFRLALPPDEYYVIANLDADKDGRYSKGDGLGGYGTIDITMQPPTVLTLAEGETQEIEVVISARYDDDGRLHATPPGIEAHIEQGGIAGRIVWDGHTVEQGILTLSYAPDFSTPIAMPITVSGDGSYRVSVLPGSYYVMVVVDANNDQKTGIADGVGIYGTRHPVRGEPTAVHVFPGDTTAHIDIGVLAIYIDADGNMAEIEDGGRWEIRKLYGEPEDIFRVTRNGRLNEEWNYWTKGLSFVWKANGAGWELSNTESFTLKEDVDPKLIEPKLIEKDIGNENAEAPDASTMGAAGQLSAFIYFAYDGMIWGISPDSNSTPLGIGHNPTVANDGTLIYQDRDGNVIIRNREMPDGGLLLDRRKMADDVAISPDAEYLAYIRPEFGDRTRLIIQHISSGSEFTVPSTALQSFTPAWNSDGTILAYVTAGSIENPDAAVRVDGQQRRNIYAFDQIAQRVEPIVISPDTDDIEPTWSPANPNQLAFTRKVGDYQQIWLVTYSSDGVPTEKQLTRRGGSHPAWVPPEGRWLIYENNGQLWKIDTTNPETTETALIHNGHVVFGREPAAVAGNPQANTTHKN